MSFVSRVCVYVTFASCVGQPSYRAKINKTKREISHICIFLKTVHLSAVTVALIYCNNIPTNDTLGFDAKIYSCEVKSEI